MSELPTGDPETFLGEFEEMDLSELVDDTSAFMVAQQTGEPKSPRYVPSTIRGPYTFYEMVEEVGQMWENEQVHAKVIYCERDRDLPIRWLDECTIDFIEARWQEILTDGFLSGSVEKEYDVRAGILTEADCVEKAEECEH